MAGLPLPHRVAKIAGGEVVFLVREKMVSLNFSGAARPRL
jgi:hypothetical protein